MRRSRRSRITGREYAIAELFDTTGLEAEPLSSAPDEAFPLRPFASGNPYHEELANPPVNALEDDPVRLHRRARRAARRGRRTDALSAYRELLELAPDHIEGRLELARLYESGDAGAEALGQLDEAVASAPGRVDLLVARGALHGRMKDYRAAEEDLRHAIATDPDHADAWFNLGVVQLRRGRLADAVGSYRRSLATDDEQPDAWYYLGEALHQLGDIDGATQALEQASAQRPSDPRPYQFLGRILDRCARTDEAKAMYRKAREVAQR